MSKRQYVFHPERGDEKGVIIRDDRRKAWTYNDLSATAPDSGMVRVRWANTFDRSALFWEYLNELTSTPVAAGVL